MNKEQGRNQDGGRVIGLGTYLKKCFQRLVNPLLNDALGLAILRRTQDRTHGVWWGSKSGRQGAWSRSSRRTLRDRHWQWKETQIKWGLSGRFYSNVIYTLFRDREWFASCAILYEPESCLKHIHTHTQGLYIIYKNKLYDQSYGVLTLFLSCIELS